MKNFHLWDKLFSQPEIPDKWEELLFNSQKNRFYSEQWSFSLKIDLHLVSIMASTSRNILEILENTISPRQKRILQLLFLLVETIIKIRMNTILLRASRRILELSFYLCKPLLKSGGIQFFLRKILATGQLIFWLVKNISFLHFSEIPGFIPASGNGFFSLKLVEANF